MFSEDIKIMDRFFIAVFLVSTSTAMPSMNIFPSRHMQYQPQYSPNNDPNWEQNMYYYDQSQPKFDRNANPANFNASIETPEKPTNLPAANVPPSPPAPSAVNPIEEPNSKEDSVKSSQLQKMVQELYLAQGQVQLEASEIKRAQTIASAAQQNLEDSANNVRVITAALRTAQESVANTALRAQTAQLQLAAHDQLLFTARQKVDALSAQLVGLQAEVGITAGSRPSIDLPALLNRLKQPLQPEDQPKPLSPVANFTNAEEPSHPMTIHSAEPISTWSQQQPPLDEKQSAESAGRLRRSGLQAHDVQDLLSWVRREKNAELLKATSGNADAFNADREQDYSKRFVRDFVANMQNLNGHQSEGYGGESANRFGETEDRRRRNAKYIRGSLRAVDRRRRRQARRP